MLTERVTKTAAAPGEYAVTLWDDKVTGLGLQVTPAGRRSFVLRYKAADGRRKQTILARVGELSLREARKRAAAELVAIRAGEADPLERRRAVREAPTVAEGLDRYFNEYVPARMDAGRLAPSTVRKYRTLAERYVRPAMGKKRVADITIRDVERMAKKIASDVQRNRTVVFASRLFNLFETWEWRPQHTNPARGVEKAREEARDRVLAPSELAALSAALAEEEKHSPAAVAAVRFAAVTGLRISEVLGIRWEHVEPETGRLILPETKTGRRVHDLPTPALAILSALPRVGPWAFTTPGRRAAVTYKTAYSAFRRAAARAGLEDVRPHDLRRGYMTNAAAAGVGTHVLRDLLGHKTTAMADRYVRAVGNPVRDARERVSGAVAAMMAGNGGEVVPMVRRDG